MSALKIEVTLQEKQKIAFKTSFDKPVVFYGGAKGGGKSYLIRARELYRRLKYPNTKGLIIRKTYPELLSNHIRMFWKEYPVTKNWFKQSEKTIYWPNGSITEFSYLKSENDVYTYQGREYEDISIDEITQHTEEVFKVLRGSNRTSSKEFTKLGGVPSMMLTGNPGGVGHAWVKRIFVDKEYKPRENPNDFAFIQAFVQDNKALLDADPTYLRRLEDLPGHLRKAYLDGDWNIFAGQAFPELSYHIHVVKPFKLPTGTRYFAGYDHGYNHPFSFVLFAITPAGICYVTNHYTGRLKRPDEIAKGIKQYTNGLGRIEIYAGTDLWSRQRDGSPTVADQFYEAGITTGNGYVLVKANTDRVQGVSEIRKWIGWKNKDSDKPLLFFFESALDVFNTVQTMQFDARKPEDVMKMDASIDGTGGDDAYDAFRYGIMSRIKAPIVKDESALNFNSPYSILQDHLKNKERARRLSIW